MKHVMNVCQGAIVVNCLLTVGCILFLSCCGQQEVRLINSNQNPPADLAALSFTKSAAWIDDNWEERYETLLLQEKEKAPNFNLHTSDGVLFNLYDELDKGKPILLLSGSHSCPKTRRNLDPINQLTKKYQKDLTVILVYTLEAHPVDTLSPYSIKNEIWITKRNMKDTVLINNPQTYQKRKELCEMWSQKYKVVPMVLVDTPGNDFWLNYGQSPNLAYLIKTDKTVFGRQLFVEPVPLEKQIQRLLGLL